MSPQMELGNRAVTGIELSRLAYMFGKDLQPEIGFFVVAHREHHILRRRFSFAHSTAICSAIATSAGS